VSALRVGVIVYEGVEELDVFGPYEVLRLGAKNGAALECMLLGVEPRALVHGAHGVAFAPQGSLDLPVEVLVVPGGGWVSRAPAGAFAEAERGDWLGRLVSAHNEAVVLASVCTGALLVARAGLAQGRRMTTHHNAMDDLRALGATVLTERVVDDGDLLSCGGVTSGLDLGLWILEREFTPELATAVAEEIEYRWERPSRR
jgi:transcriptional regulator GlxA family with amidase domain